MAGRESRVAKDLQQRVANAGLAARMGEVVVPTERVVEVQGTKRIEKEQRVAPGYVLLRMRMDPELFRTISSTPGVVSFVGPGGKPHPLSDQEAARLLGLRDVRVPADATGGAVYRKDQTVKIIDGPMSDFSGRVLEVDENQRTLTVEIQIFGRATPVSVRFDQVRPEN